ncbi:MAG TPA: precorrin-6y C5,15-methyltransferase (decarboxylating) subunit CbiE [Dissulfurispiraceae bacterium]|nr:precorrin-6y C5,15-methyltransferase (decarboxylating) subunit CbiE [Dissulfurispiraceae bacterium]
MKKVYVIGIGYKPLDRLAKNIIAASDIILASRRLHEVFMRYTEHDHVRERVVVINNVDETINRIREILAQPHGDQRPVTLLASGDPLFHGIGRRALREFGREAVEIVPELSSIQVAFARIKLPWDDAFFISLHGGPDPEKRRHLPYVITDIPSLIGRHRTIAVLTDRENNPARIAGVIASSPGTTHSAVRLHVCEKLGYNDERIVTGRPEEIAAGEYADPNVVIIEREGEQAPVVREPLDAGSAGGETRFGLREEEIAHARGLITKDEVRAVAIHALRLPEQGVLWDIGAGSGSLSVEAARLSPGLSVLSVERSEEQLRHIGENREKFACRNIEIRAGEAPGALDGLPRPDRVFIGGSGGKLGEIIESVSAVMLSGIVVINASTIETFSAAVEALRAHRFDVGAVQVSLARMKPLGSGHFFSALNPVFVIRGER